jgi:hypothetical protein
MHGANDIKKHKFFEGKTNWALIRNQTPPIIPKITSSTDISNFRSLKDVDDDLNLAEEKQDPLQDTDEKNPFKDFKLSKDSFVFLSGNDLMCLYVCSFSTRKRTLSSFKVSRSGWNWTSFSAMHALTALEKHCT